MALNRPRSPKARAIGRLLAAGEVGLEATRLGLNNGSERSGIAALLPELEAMGLIRRIGPRVFALPEARNWMRRELCGEDGFANQHRRIEHGAEQLSCNLLESPIRVLCAGRLPFLAPHQQAAAERVMRWAARARLQPRVTTSYGTGHIARASRRLPDPTAVSDMAIEARSHLSRIHQLLPHDCAEVVIDVCVFEKGLLQIEQERGWPRRSAKLVLRIGLEQLAKCYGLLPHAEGREAGKTKCWRDAGARPTIAG